MCFGCKSPQLPIFIVAEQRRELTLMRSGEQQRLDLQIGQRKTIVGGDMICAWIHGWLNARLSGERTDSGGEGDFSPARQE